MTADEYTRCVGLVASLWPHSTRDWTTDTLRLWRPLLDDLEPPKVLAAIHAIATEGDRFAPPPGLIRKRALELDGRQVATADQAWAEVMREVARIGTRRGMLDYATGEVCQPVWSDPLIGRVADSLGWEQLCASENLMADRAHFLRMWTEASARQRSLDAMPPAARAALGLDAPAAETYVVEGRAFGLNLGADRKLER